MKADSASNEMAPSESQSGCTLKPPFSAVCKGSWSCRLNCQSKLDSGSWANACRSLNRISPELMCRISGESEDEDCGNMAPSDSWEADLKNGRVLKAST